MIENKRNNFIDVAKGLAIFLMLWGHCIQYCVGGSNVYYFDNAVFKTIYSFHMPLFMLISGYLFSFSFAKRNLKELLARRVQSLVQPIIFCSLFNYLFTTVIFQAIRGDFSVLFNGKWLENLSSLWFLWSVLAASIIVAVVCKICKNLPSQILLLVLLLPTVAIFPNAKENLAVYPYFVLGFFYGKFKENLPSFVHKLKYLSLPAFPILLYFFEKKHYMPALVPTNGESLGETLGCYGYSLLTGIMGSVFVLTVLEFVYRSVIRKSSKYTPFKGLSRLGGKSIQIYAFSVPFLSVYLSLGFPKALSVLGIRNIFVDNFFVYSFCFTLPLAVLYAFLLYFGIKLLDKVKVTQIMFGQ